MKNTFLLIAFFTLSTISYSQTIQLDSAAFYEGKTITICSKVQGTYETKGAKKQLTLILENLIQTVLLL